jgi:acetyl-CoA carboxylase/biotin carboxylase 1
MEGSTMLPGDVLAKLALDDATGIKTAELFTGDLPQEKWRVGKEEMTADTKPHILLRSAMKTFNTILQGYSVPQDEKEQALKHFVVATSHKELPMYEIEEVLSTLAGRMPPTVAGAIDTLIADYKKKPEGAFRAEKIATILQIHADTLQDKDKTTFVSSVAILSDTAKLYTGSLEGRAMSLIATLLTDFLETERSFASDLKNTEDIIMELRKENADELSKVFDIQRGHHQLKSKVGVLLLILGHISDYEKTRSGKTTVLNDLLPTLQALASLRGKAYSVLALEARHLCIRQEQPSRREKFAKVESVLEAAVKAGAAGSRSGALVELVDETQPEAIDMVLSYLSSPSKEIRMAALEAYMRGVYSSYEITGISLNDGPLLAKFDFIVAADEAFSTGMPKVDSLDNIQNMLSSGGNSSARPPLARTSSDTVLSATPVMQTQQRTGCIICFEDVKEMSNQISGILSDSSFFAAAGDSSADPFNALHIIITKDTKVSEADQVAELEKSFKENQEYLTMAQIRRVSVAFPPTGIEDDEKLSSAPAVYTFRHRTVFKEDAIVRHLEAPLAYQLELTRLANYNVKLIPSHSRQVHLYQGVPKEAAVDAAGLKGARKKTLMSRSRYFARARVQISNEKDGETEEKLFAGVERTLVEELNVLEIALRAVDGKGVTGTHIFINVLSEAVVSAEVVEEKLKALLGRYAELLLILKVSEVELKFNARFLEDGPKIPLRLVASNPTGYVLNVETYVETENDGKMTFTSVGMNQSGELDGQDVSTSYPVCGQHDRAREYAGASTDTLYCYDYLELFEKSLQKEWETFFQDHPSSNLQMPSQFVKVQEMVVQKKGDPTGKWTEKDRDQLELVLVERERGMNDIGMVAWVLTLYTPEFPEVDPFNNKSSFQRVQSTMEFMPKGVDDSDGGRKVVLIANDITIKAGSFGTREDLLFEYASQYARAGGFPRLYFAANSGARIGLAEEIKAAFNVQWENPNDVSKGFSYIYLAEADYEGLKNYVQCKKKTLENGEVQYVITDIIGKDADLGVENLRGSGGIAGETSRAYDDIFTLTFVTGRTVGIGAYLVRLGQRTIQKVDVAPIILTGYQALNKLMGKDVYSSNAQLGGPNIMYNNGVTHVTVKDHLQGVTSTLRWLSYVPAKRGGPLPLMDITGIDMVERDVEFTPTKAAYDPRHFIAGEYLLDPDGNARWVSGFFDRGSFDESLAGWAKTVVVGRARLGGIPIGVIATECRTVEQITPADPATPTSEEKITPQAGGVWFPDSAYKTAQAIRDFTVEDLPLIIFANWRGFSGGQRDMFDEVLKFGSMIVDALVNFKQPVFVYIPPHAELRGGAWVVVDPTINSEVMEMYAADEGRGGVLEPAGMVEIKFRKADLLKTAHRLDPKLQTMDEKLKGLKATAGSEREVAELEAEINEHETKLIVLYRQIAEHFADLHDTPGRMKAKGVITDVVPWKRSRSHFYWRLRRRLGEMNLRRQLQTASLVPGQPDSALNLADSTKLMQSWFVRARESGLLRGVPAASSDSDSALWSDDRAVLAWMKDENDNINRSVKEIREKSVRSAVVQIGREDPGSVVKGMLDLIEQLDQRQKDAVVKMLRRGVIFGGSQKF